MMIYWYYYFLSHIIVVVNDERLGSMAMSPSFLMGTFKESALYYLLATRIWLFNINISQIEPIDTQMQKNIA